MPYLELSLRTTEDRQPRYERALEDLGALSVTLLDADADTPNEHAILEPGVGQMPVWPTLVLTALFDAGTDPLALLAALEAFDPELDWTGAAFRTVEDQDWERAWLDTFRPMRFGARTWIVPWNQDLPEEATGADAAVVRLDPGLAFGSGTHPTTALCLRWLDGLAAGGRLQGARVLDFGCGSGILALAALKLGAARAIGVDNDDQAIAASRDNAQRNGVPEKLDLYLPQQFPQLQSDVLVANILAGPLGELAPVFAQSLISGGALALSGILDGQQDELLARYSEWFVDLRATQRDGWVRIDGTRR